MSTPVSTLIHPLRSGVDLEVTVWESKTPQIQGVGIVAHPHPLQGGTKDHKVVHIIAKSLNQLGYRCYCPNFRGVGLSTGVHDAGLGETTDLIELWQWIHAEHPHLPSVIAGFSFGGYVASHVQRHILQQYPQHSCRLVLAGPAIGKYDIPEPAQVPEDSLIIHGEVDEIIPLEQVLKWAKPQHLPVVVIPGAGHFFHGQLMVLQKFITRFLSEAH
jgi:alpha/beta superfamily hydrolase